LTKGAAAVAGGLRPAASLVTNAFARKDGENNGRRQGTR
jgi:hypothetical protein